MVGRDNTTDFAILRDDNNCKPVARLWFNRSKTRLAIESPEDIYRQADRLRATVASHLARAA